MGSAIFFFSLWIVALFAGYKFVLFNINKAEKNPERYFENMD